MQNKHLFILVGIVLSIVGCSKSRVLNCDSNDVRSSLLNVTIGSTESVSYFYSAISDFHAVNTTNKLLTCKANLTLISDFNIHDQLVIPIQYNLTAPNDKDLNLTLLNDIRDFNAKKQAWINHIAEEMKKIADYQRTPIGALYAVESDDEQRLYFNGNPVIPQISNYKVSIEKSFHFNDEYVFLIGSYTGTTLDAGSANNFLVSIERSGAVYVSPPFAYQINGIIESAASLIINGKSVDRPYAEESDFPVYMYESGTLNLIRDIKPESYYLEKFSHLQPAYIVNQAQEDNCFDNEQKELNTSNICDYAYKYCFEFRALVNPPHDDNYSILKASCQK